MAADSNAKFAQGALPPLARGVVHIGIEAAAMTVHRHDQRPEAAHAELPERFGIEIVEVDVLDRLDPGRLERRRAADDREICAAHFLEGVERVQAQATLAD